MKTAAHTWHGTPSRALAILRDALAIAPLANRYPALHGMRVLAILGILQIHVTQVMLQQGLHLPLAFTNLSNNLFFAMDLFFLMSGFLIGAMLLEPSAEPGPRGLGRFWARRIFRTFPPYYVVLTALLLPMPEGSPHRENALTAYAYLTNYSRQPFDDITMNWGWSLCVEEHFYLLAPLLVTALLVLRSHRTRIGVLLAIVIAPLALRLSLAAALGDAPFDRFAALVYRQTHTRFDLLALGVLAAYLLRHLEDRIRALLAHRAARFSLLAVSFSCFVCLILPALFGRSALYYALAWGTLSGAMLLPILLFAVGRRGPILLFLSRPAFLVPATLGYGVYLVHPPVCALVVGFLAHRLVPLGVPHLALWPMALVGLAAISLLYAYVLHLVVEKPMLALRRRLFP